MSTSDFVIGLTGCTTTSIVPTVKINGVNWANSNAISIKSGDSVSIAPPALNGSWSWVGPNDFTSNSRDLSFGKILTWKSGSYRVTYADVNSCISTHALTIDVTGDEYCSTPIVPFLMVNTNPWQQVATASLNSGGSVQFGPQPANGQWRWTGPNGFTSTARQYTVANMQPGQNGIYRASYTNTLGCFAFKDFEITVDGVFTSFNDLASDEKNQILLYPNPASNAIVLSNLPDNASVSLFDLSGVFLRTLKSLGGNNEVNVDVSDLKSGCYFIRIDDNKNTTLKFIKK